MFPEDEALTADRAAEYREAPPPGGALLRDGGEGSLLAFERPIDRLVAGRPEEVVPALARAAELVEGEGLWAVGFLAYEAGPAFDPALAGSPAADGPRPPLLSFTLYEPPRRVEDTARPWEPSALPPPAAGPWRTTMDREAFEAAFRRIQEHLAAGETYQANLSFRLRSPLGPEPHRRLATLALGSGTPWAAFLDCGRFLVASASPELFFGLAPGPAGGGRVVCRPMKGTAPRGRTLGEELEHARRLAASPKERAENVMVLDMVRNDLGRIARPGSVEVSRVFHVERYPTVLQMTSTATAETNAGAPEIFAALFPSASITGAPKIAAARILAEVETTPRGVYTGAVGYLAPGGRARFSVAIRTLTADLETGVLEQGVGSGVVRDSRAGAEWAECLLKARWAGGRVEGIEEGGGAGGAPVGGTAGEGETARSRSGSRRGRAGRGEAVGTGETGETEEGRPGGASDPISEAASGAVEPLRLLETLLWRPGAGYFLLADHLERLARSAAWFSFGVAPREVRQRLAEHARDLPPRLHRVRLTVGRDGDAVVESRPLEPAPAPLRPLRVGLAAEPVDGSDPLLSHKTTRRGVYERARASRPDCDDVLLVNRRGELTESTIANLVLRHRGRSITPPRSCGLLAGTLRERLVRSGAVREEVVRPGDLEAAEEVWLVSSVRGWRLVEVARETIDRHRDPV